MIELWKLQREVRRIASHISGIISLPFEVLGNRRPWSVSASALEFCAGRKVAIFVVYQPKGIALSTLRTVAHLAENGFSVCVVSNAKLSTRDKDALGAVAAEVLERPNIGYDFGAYQAAIRLLPDFGRQLSCLVLLNDSVWFPLHTNSKLLQEMERHAADVTSAQIFGETLFTDRPEQRLTPILGSYFLMFKPVALCHPVFRSFWQNYRMSSNKETTIRRGERGLSRALFQSGLRCAGMYNQARFNEAIAALDDDELRACLADLVILDRHVRAQRANLLAEPSSPGWSERARSFALAATKKKNYIGSSPLVSYHYLKIDVVKKNNEMLYRLARQNLCRQITSVNDGSLDPQLKAELLQAVIRDRLPHPFRPAGTQP